MNWFDIVIGYLLCNAVYYIWWHEDQELAKQTLKDLEDGEDVSKADYIGKSVIYTVLSTTVFIPAMVYLMVKDRE